MTQEKTWQFSETVGKETFSWNVLDIPDASDATFGLFQYTWLDELLIEWFDDYSNTPDFMAWVSGDMMAFTRQPVWYRHPSKPWMYVAEHEGICEAHVHDGALTWSDERVAWVSTQQQGYGGREFVIFMDPALDDRFKDGRNKVILRGPWNGAAPSGYVPLSIKDVSRRKDQFYPFCFGPRVKKEVIMSVFKHFFPNHTLIEVRNSHGRTFIEPLKPGETLPKDVRTAQRIYRANNQPVNVSP